ncbi:MAG: VTT domain-containing protein, partial [Acidobacteriota bacterium]
MPPKAWLQVGVLVALLAFGFALIRFTPLGEYFTRDQMIALLERLRSMPYAPLVLIAAFGVLAPLGVPMSPVVVGGGVVFGPWLGSLYNTMGLVLGAMTAFVVGKVLGRDFVVALAGKRLKRVERVFERRGFWPLVQSRFLPLPFWLVSFGAAMAGVKAPRFLVTSTLGLIPSTLMHTYFSSRLILEPSATIGVLYILVWGAFNVVTGWPTIRQGRRRRQRYRELMAER